MAKTMSSTSDVALHNRTVVAGTGMVGPGLYSQIIATISWSWNVNGEPAGPTWYEAKKTIHST